MPLFSLSYFVPVNILSVRPFQLTFCMVSFIPPFLVVILTSPLISFLFRTSHVQPSSPCTLPVSFASSLSHTTLTVCNRRLVNLQRVINGTKGNSPLPHPETGGVREIRRQVWCQWFQITVLSDIHSTGTFLPSMTPPEALMTIPRVDS